jgi:DNA-binding MarR family transcriptional regulator
VEESIVLALLDLANHLEREGERLARTASLTTPQWLVLLHIAGDPSLPAPPGDRAPPERGVLASDIADARGVSRASISVVVSSLLRRGLARQIPDPRDRRRRCLVLTTAGHRAVRRIEPLRRDANRRLLRDLNRTQRRELLDRLEACLRTLWRDKGRPEPPTGA